MKYDDSHLCSFRVYETNFFDNKENFIHSGFLSPRIAYIRKGRCEVKTDKGSLFLSPGSVWYLPRFYPYSSHWVADPEVSFIAIEFEADSFGVIYRDMQVVDGLDVEAYFSVLQDAENGHDSFELLAAFYSVLAALAPFLNESSRDIPSSILQSVDFLSTNYLSEFRVSDLAGDCYLSESRFYYLFKKATGFSPVDYKNYLKINQAISALRRGETLEDICERFHFCSPSFFRRLLKKFTGKSPSQIKREYEKL